MKGKKILVVDDEGYICDLVVDFLAFENITGITAEDFETAIGASGKNDIDLIISDVNIGNNRVEDFITSLRERGIHIPVALMTGDHRIDDRYSLQAGAVGVIHKPFQVVPFLTSIKKFLEST